ncbi:hypothetical protein C7974DRAFT_452827 [Boeremia exigua]|uniref:uncharacterized protein n=1 Tax=Boeremia exigua TaxID=749465 RepID=UPI001E8EEB75|nr:uncharacterized protein C7974DRAFT_452827 [Boeremia exigua]KAH6633493.1 hypothetical protein C7974DRAFT_452827 [Boeremia exigua]
MGHVANNDKVQEEIRLDRPIVKDLEFMVIPATPETLPESAMADPSDTDLEQHKQVVRGIDVNKAPNDGDGGKTEDPYGSLDPNTTLLIPITNPSDFPIQRLQEVQSDHQPSTHITNMWCHKTPTGAITQVTADIQDGSINHLYIRDPRWLRALGLAAPDFDTIHFDSAQLRLDETFKIRIFAGQRPQRLENWIMGELIGARHAFLYWLDERRSAYPTSGPYAAESKAIARATGRRALNVMKEIEGVWELEQGSDGKEYRENRIRYLGEDPTYPAGAEERRNVRSMFA